jgi:hypothetical protein
MSRRQILALGAGALAAGDRAFRTAPERTPWA